MLRRGILCCVVMGNLLIAVLGCRSHPELSKTNDEHSGEWRRIASNTHTTFAIKASNRINTPQGEDLVGFSITCDPSLKKFFAAMSMQAEPQSGSVALDVDEKLSQETWSVHSSEMNGRHYYILAPSTDQAAEIVRQLEQAKAFEFELTPKGGKPQRSNFKLLNIGALLDQEENCKTVRASIQ
jgi:hypothetical protein